MKICKIKDCNSKHYAKGYCSKHYQRLFRNGDPLKLIKDQHGMAGTLIYTTWLDMKQRCYYPKSINFNIYGGRGITVCERWNKSFRNFYKDMGDRPFKGAQLDRIDNNGNYSPNNCRWVTTTENNRNRPSCKLTEKKVKDIRELKYDLSVIEIAEMFDISKRYVYKIINKERWKYVK